MNPPRVAPQTRPLTLSTCGARSRTLTGSRSHHSVGGSTTWSSTEMSFGISVTLASPGSRGTLDPGYTRRVRRPHRTSPLLFNGLHPGYRPVMAASTPVPLRIEVPQATLDDLDQRLA